MGDTAQGAWEKYVTSTPYERHHPGSWGDVRDAFQIGYRAGQVTALTGAADEMQDFSDGVVRTTTDPNAYARMVAYNYAAEVLRARAAEASDAADEFQNPQDGEHGEEH